MKIFTKELLDSAKERLFKHSFPEPNTGCWIWTASTCGGLYKYGKFSIGNWQTVAHRASWIVFNNKNHNPVGMDVCHKCDNHLCINPDHLFLGTRLENLLDSVKKRRVGNFYTLSGKKHKLFKLSDQDIRDIIELSKTTSRKKIAEKYRVRTQTIDRYLNGERRSAATCQDQF